MLTRSVIRDTRAVVGLMFTVAMLTMVGCARADGRDGLYLRTYYGFNQLQSNTILLSGDRIAWNPKGGIDPFDFDAAEKSSPGNTGHFRIDGAQMTVTWADGTPAKTWKVEYEKGKMSAIDGGLVSKVSAYAKDEKLDTTFGGVMMAGGENGITAGRSMTFTKDGHFSLSTIATAELNPNVVGGKGSAANDSKGTYALTGNTLTLTFDDGKTEAHTVFPYSTAIDPAKGKLEDEKLFFDTMMLAREK